MAEIKHSVCALDCPDCCSILVTIEDGKATKLRGNPDHPITRGFLCPKVTRYLDREYHADRLLYPMKRIGAKGDGRFTRISWAEALDTIVANLHRVANDHGTEAILPYSYAGTMGYLNGSGMDRRFFHRLGASRLDRTICSAAGMVGITEALGVRYSTEPEQYRHSKLILAWGSNIHGTNVHLWPFIQEALRNGAKLYTIDPVKTRTAALATKHFPINPGTDMALAMSMMHVIFSENLHDKDYLSKHTTNLDALREHVAAYPPQRAAELTGIAAEEIVQLAREYATTRPAVIRANYGIQRSERGGRSIHSIAYLPVITGSWRDVGGGMSLSTSQAFQVNRPALELPELQKKSTLGRDARILNMSELGRALNEVSNPPVHALVVYNSNPAAIAPNQSSVFKGLRRDNLFTVVLEQFQTDTADFADIVLPVTTFLEHTDLYLAYGHHYLQLARPALPAPGETKSNVEIFRLLAKGMGFDDPCFNDTEDDMIRTLLNSQHPFVKGITLQQLEEQSSVRLNVSEPGTPFLPFANGGFGTTDGKVRFQPEVLNYTPPVESRHGDQALVTSFPLELVSSKNDNSMNSTFGNRDDTHEETAALWMHTDDAVPRGITNGDQVRVFNNRGSVLLKASVNGAVHKGVVRCPSVSWPKRNGSRYGINVLSSERLTDIGGGPTFYSCLVQVERCGD